MSKKSTTEEFIIKAKKIHGDEYDYSLVVYINAVSKVKYICSEHGVYEQTPNKHLSGRKCPTCGLINKSRKRRKTIEQFTLEGNNIHNDFYTYEKIIYKNNNTNIIITCPIHGDFLQIPKHHLQGHGCPTCAITKSRLRRIKEIEKDKFNGNQLIPSYNTSACKLFDKLSEEKDIHIQHAMNGGEYHIKELGYWVDGYDEINNVVYEFDENYHNRKKQKEKDLIRQNEITNHLNCEFIRIKE